ncbi:MAG: hypothetical protein J1G04_06905 [Clostridiales bacterium]|nr:hypothetical protein [Clostridiales bacterium]
MELTKHRKWQIIFACIPFLGFALVLFNIQFFLKKQYGVNYLQQFLFFVFCIPAIAIGFLIMTLLYNFVIYPFSTTVAVWVAVSLIVFAVILMGIGFAEIGMEKLYIYKFFKNTVNNQNETDQDFDTTNANENIVQ